MVPGNVETALPYVNGTSKQHPYRPKEIWGTPLTTRKISPHDDVHFDSSLKPRAHRIASKPSASKILLLNVQILDSTGAQPYPGDVLIEGERIRYVGAVPGVERLCVDPSLKVIQGNGRTLMSGLGDAHTHFTWNGGALDSLGNLGIEEHTLCTAQSAMVYLDSGYTMCFGAASAKDRLDSVVRDAINQGILPGPRYLANAREIARRGGELAAEITAFADGPLEMREIIRSHAKIGVDQIKLSMSGEDMVDTRPANDCYFTDDEVAACVDEAHRHGLRVCSHARSRDSIAQCIKHGVDVIYHASYMDEETMDALEKNKHRHVVAPGLNWLYATLHDAAPFGISYSQAEKTGYKKELEAAIRGCKEMHERGITVLPGGDYGFAWTPHGTYARDLEHFVKLLDYTPMETIIAATAGVAQLFMQQHELGKIQPGYYADCILVDGNPLEDISILQDHDRLNVIMINGRIHKASPRDFAQQLSSSAPAIEEAVPQKNHFSNYITYLDEQGKQRVGHLDLDTSRVIPLVMQSGAPVHSLYQVIELKNEVTPMGEPILLDEVQVLPPFSDRDILAVGKNYAEHAAEFNKSGYDSSDKIDQPSHPVIFTKRSTSIIASGEEIYPHSEFTESLDYEGEIGVVLGRSGYQIPEEEAMEYVWGYTIINDVTARERQRDHKQFYIGKSADTFCPMGPLAVPVECLPKKLRVQTFVNGEKRQDATTDDLIFSIPTLVKTLSEGATLRAGDVIATGTPAGVGFGQNPVRFLKPGDRVEVEVTGLGRLQNVIGTASEKPSNEYIPESYLPELNLEITAGGIGLTCIEGKQMNIKKVGNGPETAIFVHGLGGTGEYFTPIVKSGDFESRFTSYVYDLEGHGLTPTNVASRVSIESYADDLANIINFTSTTAPITLIAHSMGSLIAITYALRNPSRIKNLILMGPVSTPLPPLAKQALTSRAQAVRNRGLLGSGTAEAVSDAGTSSATKMFQPVAYTAVRSSLLNTNPEGYAKACTALAECEELAIEKLTMPVLVMAGDEDKTAPVQAVTANVHERCQDSRLEVLRCTGHWHAYESPEGVSRAMRSFLA